MLALQKIGYLIILSTGDKIRILLDKNKPAPNWNHFITKKSVVQIDGHTINFSYVVDVSSFDPMDKKFDGVETWTNDLPNGLKELAKFLTENHTKRRSTETLKAKITLSELQEKIMKFKEHGKKVTYKRRYDIFIKNGGDESLINNAL